MYSRIRIIDFTSYKVQRFSLQRYKKRNEIENLCTNSYEINLAHNAINATNELSIINVQLLRIIHIRSRTYLQNKIFTNERQGGICTRRN